MNARSCLYVGQVFHRRSRPRVHVLRYRVFSMLLDLAEIDSLAARFWPFSRNRFNLLAFHDRDFGLDERPLERQIASELAEAGIAGTPVRILLSCYPRVLGYAFNPLSVFYCLDDEDRVFAVVHEVHNTFGERHRYVLAVDPPLASSGSGQARDESAGVSGVPHREAPPERWIRQRTDKALFVSPFNHMNMRYEFRLGLPGERQVLAIRVFDADGPFLSASYVAGRRAFDTRQLLALLVRFPLMTFKVTAGIHWEAARLWIKRVPWFTHCPKPAPDALRTTGSDHPIDPSFDARDHVRHR